MLYSACMERRRSGVTVFYTFSELEAVLLRRVYPGLARGLPSDQDGGGRRLRVVQSTALGNLAAARIEGTIRKAGYPITDVS